MNDERLNEVATDVADTAEKLNEVLEPDAPITYRNAEGEEISANEEAAGPAPQVAESKMDEILRSRKAPAVIKRAGLSKPRRLVSRAGRIYDKDRD